MPIKNSAYEMLIKHNSSVFKGILFPVIFSVVLYVGKPKARRLTTEGNVSKMALLVLVFSSPLLRRKRSGSVILHVIVFSWSIGGEKITTFAAESCC